MAREIKRHFILHIGPTNSGKTYNALQAYKQALNGVYLAPLRLLAFEVFEKLNMENIPCDMLTGEEEIRIPNKPCEKCVTDITEIKGKDGKLYTSVIFDCFDVTALGISMDTNMKAELCVETVKNAVKSYPKLKGAILHSDRGSQYTSEKYREALKHAGFVQSMNSAGGRCHDNARCESMWARMKEELFYSRNRKSEDYTVAELKTVIWRYYMSYWNNRRICSANGGLPPAVKRKRYYESLVSAA